MKKAIIALALSALSVHCFCQDQPEVTIRFYDQAVYFLGDPIMIEMTVANATTQPLSFNVADNRVFSFDFDVRTTTNLAVNHAPDFITARTSDQPVYFRTVTLQPGEKYAIVEDLTKYAAFTNAGLYVVQGKLFPQLWRGDTSAPLISNRLSLNVKPPVVTEQERAVVEAQTGALITRQAFPPDQVVQYTISARQKSQWDKFFLYLDLESLLRKNPEKDRVWRRSSQQEQQTMLAQFKQQLMASTISTDINVIPTSFEIQNTTYGQTDGTVQVLEKFAHTDYTELRQYTYDLKKVEGFWIITDYEVKNLGTQ